MMTVTEARALARSMGLRLEEYKVGEDKFLVRDASTDLWAPIRPFAVVAEWLKFMEARGPREYEATKRNYESGAGSDWPDRRHTAESGPAIVRIAPVRRARVDRLGPQRPAVLGVVHALLVGGTGATAVEIESPAGVGGVVVQRWRWKHEGNPEALCRGGRLVTDDPLDPARGVLVGIVVSVPL